MASATALLGPSRVVTVTPPASEQAASNADRLAQLTPSQREVAQKIIGSRGSNIVLAAGPGVGKTFTMTRAVEGVLALQHTKAIVIAPTNMALQQWSTFENHKDVHLTTAAGLVGRGITTPRLPPSTAVFESRCHALRMFLLGCASELVLDLVLIIWDEAWNTPAQDINHGQDILSRVTQLVPVTMVFMGDPFQLRPVDGDSPLLSGPFHELTRANLDRFPHLSRRKLLENLITIPGVSQRTRNAPEEVAELVRVAARVEALLRSGRFRAADAALVELQSLTARMVPPAGPDAVYLTATRAQQLRRQLEALRAHPDPDETLVTGLETDRAHDRTCVVVGTQHMLTRYVAEERLNARKSDSTKTFPNGLRGMVLKFDRATKRVRGGSRPKRRRVLTPEVATPDYVQFRPEGETRSYRLPATAVTTTTAMTVHRAQGATMPAGQRVVLDLADCGKVYHDQQDLVAALVVGLSRAKDAPTIVVNYEPGALLRTRAAAEDRPVVAQVTHAFLGMVQRVVAGGMVRIVPRKVRLQSPSRDSLQRQLNKAYKQSSFVQIKRWDPATNVATLVTGLEVQAIKGRT